MECAGNGRALLSPRSISQPWLLEAIGTAEWTGTPLKGLLQRAGIKEDALEILSTGLDQGVQGDQVHYYQRSLSVQEASRDEVLLAYQMNGGPLQPQHGYPLRLLVPGWYGMASVKWLDSIEAIGEPFQGYQMAGAHRYSQSSDDRRTGQPDQSTGPHGPPRHTRLSDPHPAGERRHGDAEWQSVAGRRGVSRVEVSVDAGSTWAEARLGEAVSLNAWRGWSFNWQARPGRHTLCVRATDTEGSVQPLTQQWNHQGMGNNLIQRVDVVVE